MIQRIQSTYLLVAVILLAFMVFMPFANMISESTGIEYQIGFMGITANIQVDISLSTVPLSILIGLCLAIAFVTIFLFKKRMLQIRLTIVNIILLLGLQGLTYYYINAASNELNASYSFTIVFVFPVVSAILSFLALRAISKDEALIRSLNRLR